MENYQKKICIISHQHISRNPRTLKECIALDHKGFNVIVLTSVYNKSLLKEDLELIESSNVKYIFYCNLTIFFFKSYIDRFLFKLGRWLVSKGIDNKWALGYSPNTCFAIALRQNADLYICHQELPTYIGMLLLKKGRNVAFDLEDWYAEDLPPSARKYRPQRLLAKTENFALNNGSICYTTSSVMATELALRYKSKTPKVIYNSFEGINKDHTEPTTANIIKMIWLSQTIGPDRGLEEIVQAMNRTYNIQIELNLRGNVARRYKELLQSSLTNSNHSIKFLPLIPNNEIAKDLTKFDIGLALELNKPLSRDLTITNKIFHYLAVGLPVIASATQGQLSLKEDFEDSIYFFKSIQELTLILSNLKRVELQNKSNQIKATYAKKYDWSIVEKQLLSLVQNALKND